MPNYIRTKQIDQGDLSGVVQNVIDSNQFSFNAGLIGTGVNISNVSYINLSGVSINLIDSSVSGIGIGINDVVYTTGNQTIAGNKTFASRPKVNGTGVLLSGDIPYVQTNSYFYVDATRTDSYIENGNILYPYKTLSGAYNAAKNIAHFHNPTYITLLSPIAENLTIDKGYINLVGNNTNKNDPIRITGSLVFAATGIGTTATDNNFSIAGLGVTATSNNKCILFSGNKPQRLFIQDCWLIAKDNGTCLYSNNTNTTSRLQGDILKLSPEGVNTTAIDIVSGTSSISFAETSSLASVLAYVRNNSTLNISNSQIETSGAKAFQVENAARLTLLNSVLTNTANPSTGIFLKDALSTAVVVGSAISVPANANSYAINGVANSYLFYKNLYFSIDAFGASTESKIGNNVNKNLINSYDPVVYSIGDQTIYGVKTFQNITSNSITSPNYIGIPGGNDGTYLGGGAGNLTLNAGNADDHNNGNGGNAGSISLNGANGGDGDGGNAGSINLNGGTDAGHGGSINLYGNQTARGGSISSIGGDQGSHGGSINLDGSSMETNYIGGSINLAGGNNGPGGSIDLSNNGGSFVIKSGESLPNLKNGSIFNNTNDNLYIRKSGIWEQVITNRGDQIISGIKTFANSGVFSLSGAAPLNIKNNPLSVVGSGNSYLQLNIQNRATGTTSTADLVITANNGTDTTNYINLGINNSGYNDPAFSNGSGLDGYLFINGGSLDIGTQTTGTSIEFHVGGTTLDKTIARIDSSGLNIVSGNLTVSGTRVLLSGSTPFIMNFGHKQNTPATGPLYQYFGPQMDIDPVSLTNNEKRRTQILQDCYLRKVVWNSIAKSNFPTPNSAMTGYFKNFGNNALSDDQLAGVQVTSAINIPNSNIIYANSTGTLNIPIKSGDYVSFYYQTNFSTAPVNLAISVNAYFYV